jgi:hypothetical protein
MYLSPLAMTAMDKEGEIETSEDVGRVSCSSAERDIIHS